MCAKNKENPIYEQAFTVDQYLEFDLELDLNENLMLTFAIDDLKLEMKSWYDSTVGPIDIDSMNSSMSFFIEYVALPFIDLYLDGTPIDLKKLLKIKGNVGLEKTDILTEDGYLALHFTPVLTQTEESLQEIRDAVKEHVSAQLEKFHLSYKSQVLGKKL